MHIAQEIANSHGDFIEIITPSVPQQMTCLTIYIFDLTYFGLLWDLTKEKRRCVILS